MVIIYILILLLGSTFLSQAEVVKNAHVEAQLIPEVIAGQPGQPFLIALRIKMDEGWHTYWKNPGDAGLPTGIKWKLPDQFEAGDIQWPYPERFQENELVTYGYHDEVLLLTEIKVPDSVKVDSSQTILAQVRWLACEKVCIPGKALFTLELPIQDNAAKANDFKDDLHKAKSRLPLEDSSWKISAKSHNKDLLLNFMPPSGSGAVLSDFYFFADRNDIIAHGAQQIFIQKEEGYELTLKRSAISPSSLDRLSGVLVFLKSHNGVQAREALQVDIPIKLQ